jgi:hypothetical protein
MIGVFHLDRHKRPWACVEVARSPIKIDRTAPNLDFLFAGACMIVWREFSAYALLKVTLVNPASLIECTTALTARSTHAGRHTSIPDLD